MSLGSRSGVNWIRRTEQSMDRASALASMVLPTPGTSSTSRWPSASSTVTASRTTLGLPSITVSIAVAIGAGRLRQVVELGRAGAVGVPCATSVSSRSPRSLAAGSDARRAGSSDRRRDGPPLRSTGSRARAPGWAHRSCGPARQRPGGRCGIRDRADLCDPRPSGQSQAVRTCGPSTVAPTALYLRMTFLVRG